MGCFGGKAPAETQAPAQSTSQVQQQGQEGQRATASQDPATPVVNVQPAMGGPGGLPADVPPIDLLQFLLGGLDPQVLEQLLIAQNGGGQQSPAPRTGPPPTGAAALRALPKIKVTEHDIQANEGSECTICVDDLVVGQPATRIPCGHLYHEACIKDWLLKSNECPVCRYELPTDDAEYERGRKERMAGRKIRMRRADLVYKSPKELRRLAEHLGIEIRGCLEKGEIVDCIAASSRVSIINEDAIEADQTAPGNASGLRIFSKSQLEAMSDDELKKLLEEVGVDTEGCADKNDFVQRLVLSGRIVLTLS